MNINHILVTLFFSKGTSISFKKEQKLLSSQGTSTSTLCFPSPSSTRSSSWWELMSKMKFSLSTCLRFYNCSIAAGNMVAYKVILSNILPVCLWNEQMSKLSDLEPKKLIVFFWKIAHIFKGGSAWQPGHVSCDCKQWIPQVRLPVRCEFYMLWHGKYISNILLNEIPKLIF